MQSKEDLQKRYNNLPQELKEVLFDKDTTKNVYKAGEQEGLDTASIKSLSKICAKIFLGVFPLKNLEEEIKNKLDINDNTAKKIKESLNSKVFLKHKKILERTFPDSEKIVEKEKSENFLEKEVAENKPKIAKETFSKEEVTSKPLEKLPETEEANAKEVTENNPEEKTKEEALKKIEEKGNIIASVGTNGLKQEIEKIRNEKIEEKVEKSEKKLGKIEKIRNLKESKEFQENEKIEKNTKLLGKNGSYKYREDIEEKEDDEYEETTPSFIIKEKGKIKGIF